MKDEDLKKYAGDTYASLYGNEKADTLCVLIGINVDHPLMGTLVKGPLLLLGEALPVVVEEADVGETLGDVGRTVGAPAVHHHHLREVLQAGQGRFEVTFLVLRDHVDRGFNHGCTPLVTRPYGPCRWAKNRLSLSQQLHTYY